MRSFMSIVALAALFGFSVGTMPTFAIAQSSPPVPAPTEEKEKKPSMPRANDQNSDTKKKDDRGSR